MHVLLIPLFLLAFAHSVSAETIIDEAMSDRCDCSQKRGYCETTIKQKGASVYLTSSTQVCSKVTWFADNTPRVSFIIDGELAIPINKGLSPKLSTVSCEVCLDKRINTSITLGECNMEYTTPDNNTGFYVGQCVDGLPDGNGILIYQNGSEYKGDYHKGMRNGRGSMVWVNGDSYIGSWINDLPQGYGIMNWVDGRSYKGQWYKGKLQGQGELKLQDGSMVSGLWRKNQRVK